MRFPYFALWAVAACSLGACGNPDSPVLVADASSLPDPSLADSSRLPDSATSAEPWSVPSSSPPADASWPDDALPLASMAQRAVPDGSAPVDGGRPLAAGCTGASPTFSGDVVPILRNCSAGAICHGSSFDYAGLVNAPTQRDMCSPPRILVSPGDLGGSYLLNKLRGMGMCSGEQMPLGGSVTSGQIQAIADWICVGAPND